MPMRTVAGAAVDAFGQADGSATRTAIVAQGQLSSDDRTAALKRMGIEQRFGALHLGAAIAEPTRAARGMFDLRYSFSW